MGFASSVARKVVVDSVVKKVVIGTACAGGAALAGKIIYDQVTKPDADFLNQEPEEDKEEEVTSANDGKDGEVPEEDAEFEHDKSEDLEDVDSKSDESEDEDPDDEEYAFIDNLVDLVEKMRSKM